MDEFSVIYVITMLAVAHNPLAGRVIVTPQSMCLQGSIGCPALARSTAAPAETDLAYRRNGRLMGPMAHSSHTVHSSLSISIGQRIRRGAAPATRPRDAAVGDVTGGDSRGRRGDGGEERRPPRAERTPRAR